MNNLTINYQTLVYKIYNNSKDNAIKYISNIKSIFILMK